MKKLLALIVFLSGLTLALKAENQGNSSELLLQSAKRITDLYEKNFTVKMQSPELATLLANQVKVQSEKMGFPVAITISHFILTNKNKQQSCKVLLTDATPMKELLEPEANNLLSSSGIGKLLAEALLGSLQNAAKFLQENNSSFKLNKESEKYYDFLAQDEDLASLAGASPESIRIRINKETENLTAFMVKFKDQTQIRANLLIKQQGDEDIFYPVRLKLQSNQKKSFRDIEFPQIINASFSEYKFQ